jgi:transglutaminase-like putative cysteine protease
VDGLTAMGWMVRIEHVSGYRYGAEVLASYNEARMTPLTTDRQTTLECRVDIEPVTYRYRYLDYWATVVDAFDVHRRHREMTVRATSVVETSDAPDAPDGLGWHDLVAEPVIDRFAEFLAPTPYVPADPELVAIAGGLARGHQPAGAVRAAGEWVADHLSYTPGVTEVSTSALEAFRAGHGVCQDYVHLSLSLLRAMGIPARYASGYLHTRGDAEPGDAVIGESHAWIEAWLGDWWPFDPTNGVAPGERHVLVGRGRDYADVPPLKGIFNGSGTADLDVEVRLSRLA